MIKHIFILGIGAIAISFSACQEKNQKNPNALVSNSNKLDLLQSHINDSILPGNDFFNYANGKWFLHHPIPKSESGYGIFTLVEDENKDRVRKISEEATGATAEKGSNTQLIGDFFSAGMDSIGAQKLGIKAIEPQLQEIAKIQTKEEILKVIASLQNKQIGVGYNIYVSADMKNSANHLLDLSQGGLGLPDRDYYFNTDERTTEIRSEYKKHLQAIQVLMGESSEKAEKNASIIYKLESDLAKASRKLEEQRDPVKNYNKMSFSKFNEFSFSSSLKILHSRKSTFYTFGNFSNSKSLIFYVSP